MTKPYIQWDEILGRELKDMEFAQGYILACLDEGLTLQEILRGVIRAIGIKKFSKLSGMAPPNILRALDENYNPTQKTLEKLLSPFDLKLSARPKKVS